MTISKTLLLAAAIGAGALAVARGLRSRPPKLFTCLVFTGGVVGAHFTGITGTVFTAIPGEGGGSSIVTLSIFTAAGAIVIFVGAFLSIVTAKRFEAQERAHSTILSTALQNMSNGLVYIDAHGRVGLFNERLVEILELDEADLRIGMPVADFLDVVGRCCDGTWRSQVEFARDIGRWMQTGRGGSLECTLAGGRVIELEGRPVLAGGAVLTIDDVTADKTAQDRILHLAFHDMLTGLANRHSLHLAMEERFAAGQSFALLLIDLDRFKSVNDTFGHGVGDKLLVEVAGRINAIIGTEGFAARLGGDEMAILLADDMAAAVGEAVVSAIARPFVVEGRTLAIGCSIGLCRTGDADGPVELMKRADISLYEAKRNGRGRVAAYRPGMMEAVAERHAMEGDIGLAILRGEFHLAYQPCLSLADASVMGSEALIRWNHPDRGAVSPGAFIPVAEETGQIVEIGAWVLREACREAARWPDRRHIAVNVSPVQLRSPLFFAHVTGALATSGLSPDRLEIEITETAIVTHGPEVVRLLEGLRTLGVKIAMDDFGTGYSSLAHLRDLPLDRIKIDRSFVRDAASGDRHSMAVLAAIIEIGRALAIPTLAEGVETPGELELLRDLGCDGVQGFLIGRPQAAPDAEGAGVAGRLVA